MKTKKYKVLTKSGYIICPSFHRARFFEDIYPKESTTPTLKISIYEDGHFLYDEYNEWQVDGMFHRVGGPAKEWYWETGTYKKQTWYIKDKKHREDGPAVIESLVNGDNVNEEYWIDDKQYESYQQFKESLQSKKINII